ncbi:MAG: LPS export ABC transporter periplasmic protein LptC [Burkholderiales bacterium]|jgi:lipopolysaccharide export system protein LptC|nr:LPS export ABC transporter periplasmic protein LptC [Burkholderiales bacterium]
MRERLTQIVAVLLLLLLAAASYWYSRTLGGAPAPPPLPGTPDFIGRDLVLTQFDAQGRAKFKLYAAEVAHYPDRDDAHLKRPRALSLRPDQPRMAVVADTARSENSAEVVHLEGNVVVERAASAQSPPLRVDTEYLKVLPDSDQYSTDRPVQVRRGDSRIDATSMELDNIARTATFGPGRATLAPADQRPR